MSQGGQHVVPRGSKWAVLRGGASRVTGTYRTQGEAIERATEIARNQKTELYIHGDDGRIRQRNSYRDDPFPPKG